MCEFCESKVKYENHYGSFRISDFGKSKVISCEIDKCPPYVNCCSKDKKVFMEIKINFCPMCGRELRSEENE